MSAAPSQPVGSALTELDAYDAGLLNDFGGGNVDWWQDYIRAELGRAHEFYESQFAALTPEPAALPAAKRTQNVNGIDVDHEPDEWDHPAALPADVTEEMARRIGETGVKHSEKERQLFIAYMQGHCWKVGPWDAERSEYLDMHTRVLYAVWRARGALAAPAQAAAVPEAMTQAKWDTLHQSEKEALSWPAQPAPEPAAEAGEVEKDAARWRRLVNASELAFPVATIADDPENYHTMLYGRNRLEKYIDGLDEISDSYASESIDRRAASEAGACTCKHPLDPTCIKCVDAATRKAGDGEQGGSHVE